MLLDNSPASMHAIDLDAAEVERLHKAFSQELYDQF